MTIALIAAAFGAANLVAVYAVDQILARLFGE